MRFSYIINPQKNGMKRIFRALFLVAIWGFTIANEISADNCQENSVCLSYGEEDHSFELQSSVIRGQEWLLSNASEKGGWGSSTSRVVTALGLTRAGDVFHDNIRGRLHLKEMELQISLALARNEKKHLSLFVNALLSICRDPRNFYGFDLVSKLMEYAKENQFDSEYETALVHLVMCNAGVSMNKTEHKRLIFLIHKYSKRETTLSDTLVLYVLALICTSKQGQNGPNYDRRVNKAIRVMKFKQSEDGSFGNLYTSALVLQAMNAAQTDENGWNSTSAKEFILSRQRDDGSFEGYLAAYFALPALDGKSLIHIDSCLDTKKDIIRVEPKSTDDNVVISSNETVVDPEQDLAHTELISVDIWKMVDDETIASTEIVKQNSSLFDILTTYKSFDCVFKETDFGPMLTSVDGLEQNVPGRKFWAILRKIRNPSQTFREEFLTSGAADFYPKEEDIIVLKYVHYDEI